MDKDDGVLYPLSHYATNRVQLINEAFSILRGQRLESTKKRNEGSNDSSWDSIIPPSLRGIDYTELKSLCLEELRKIDTLRIVDIIEGRVTTDSKNETSSSHHVQNEDNDQLEVKRRKRHNESDPSIPMSELKKKIKKVIHEDVSSSSDGEEDETAKVSVKKKNKEKKKKHSKASSSNNNKVSPSPPPNTNSKKDMKKVKIKNGEKVKIKKAKKLKKEKKAEKVKLKKKMNQGKVESPGKRPGAVPGERTLMELLELEYRAKAIKALLKFQGFNATKIDDVFNDSNSPPEVEPNPKKNITPPPSTSVNDDSLPSTSVNDDSPLSTSVQDDSRPVKQNLEPKKKITPLSNDHHSSSPSPVTHSPKSKKKIISSPENPSSKSKKKSISSPLTHSPKPKKKIISSPETHSLEPKKKIISSPLTALTHSPKSKNKISSPSITINYNSAPSQQVDKKSEPKKNITSPSTSIHDDALKDQKNEKDEEADKKNVNDEEEVEKENDNDEEVAKKDHIDEEEVEKENDEEEVAKKDDNDEEKVEKQSVVTSFSPRHTNIHEELDYGDGEDLNAEDINTEDLNTKYPNANDEEEVEESVVISPRHTNIHEELDYGDGRDGDGEDLNTEYPDEATPITWYERWYSSKKVQKVVSSNKMYGKVRHKLKTNKKQKELAEELLNQNKKKLECAKSSTGTVQDNYDDEIPLIGSIQEYEKLFGKKIISPSHKQSVETTGSGTVEDVTSPSKIVESDGDDEDNELWGDILGNS